MNVRRKPRPGLITVELKIIGFFAGDYVNIIGNAAIHDGGSPAALLHEAHAAGLLPHALHTHLKKSKKTVAVQVNGVMRSRSFFRKTRLRAGDSVLFFSALSGG